MLVCIDVDDSNWTHLVDHLMPGQDWDAIRARGETPVASGSVSINLREYLCEAAPDIRDALYGDLSDNLARVAVMADGGISIYKIRPVPEKHSRGKMN